MFERWEEVWCRTKWKEKGRGKRRIGNGYEVESRDGTNEGGGGGGMNGGWKERWEGQRGDEGEEGRRGRHNYSL